MDWSEFITWLLEQKLRLSSIEVEKLTSIRQQIIDRWKRGNVSRPHRSTIRRLELGLGVAIDDTDPENIRLVEQETTPLPVAPDPAEARKTMVKEFNTGTVLYEEEIPISASIPAGPGKWQETDQRRIITLDSRNQFALLIDPSNGDSMQPFLQPGDMVICDMHAEPAAGDIVAAKWENGSGAIKILGDSSHVPGSYLLYSYNPLVKPIIVKKQNSTLYKVVLIHKQH
ncbi:MAG: S24 family peptidase [Ignavibacteria bacterium]|nr:S24 family peptidase [Ignavibacteria bacterium]